MSGKIFIASKVIVDPGNPIDFKHLYLVYAPNGDITDLGTLQVIRGGYEFGQTEDRDNLIIEIGALLAQSEDFYDTGETYLTRGSVELDIGTQNVSDLWDSLKSSALNLGSNGGSIAHTYPDGGSVRDTGLNYESVDGPDSGGFTNNSNATVRSILAANGILLENNLPSNMETIEGAPGQDTILAGAGSQHLLVGYGVEHIDGDTGVDTANFKEVFTGLNIDLKGETFKGTTIDGEIINIENVIGTRYDDTFVGNIASNILEGRAGNDTFTYNYSDSILGTDQFLGGEDFDTVKFEFTSVQLTSNIRNEILQLYKDILVDLTPADGVNHNFTNINLNLNSIEKIEVYKDGNLTSLVTEAHDDLFIGSVGSSSISGNLLVDNGMGADYSFGTVLTATAGTYVSNQGATVTIASNGSFTYTPLSSTFMGQDYFNYTITDAAGGTSVGKAYVLLPYQATGTNAGEALPGETNEPNNLSGGGGDDLVAGGYYSDVLFGGDGNDTIDSGDDVGYDGNLVPTGITINFMYGGAGDDSIGGRSLFVDYMDGGSGNDYITIHGGKDVALGGDGDDIIDIGGDFFYSGATYATNAFVSGGGGNDIINVGNSSQKDEVYGDGGNDEFHVSVSEYEPYVADVLDGGAGIDLIQLHINDLGAVIDLTRGYFLVNGNYNSISGFENAIGGSGSNYFIGSSVANVFWGADSDDYFDPLSGSDEIYGGDGNDIVRHVIRENIGDTDYYDGGGNNINDDEDTLNLFFDSGNFTSNVLTDLINYNSFITGGGTNLDYTFSEFDLTVTGFELFKVFVDNVEINLNATNGTSGNDTLNGNSSDNFILGGAGSDTLNGNGGNDMLNGGSGADTMTGGIGNDIYVVDDTGDIVTENSGEGTDTVNATISYLLTSNVENLLLHGIDNINGTGNSLNNSITGNDANNILDGGAGSDTLIGGKGNDTYIVDHLSDIVTESEGEGIDTVKSSVNYSLGSHVEYLTLTGTVAINGTGNSLDNVIIGNAGNNILSGGAGSDTIKGGDGNDVFTYVLSENTGVKDYYFGERGTDRLDLYFTTAEYTTAIQNEIETYRNFMLTNANSSFASSAEYQFSTFGLTAGRFENLKVYVDGIEQGAPNIIYGTEGDDIPLNGTSGNDAIFGKGGNDSINAGDGNDTLDGGTGYNTLRGGEGDDIYVLTAANLSGSGNQTYIQEYVGEGTDTLLLSDLLPSDIYTYTDNNADYYIRLKTETTATVISWADTVGGDNEIANYVEHIKFADGTTWNLASGLILNDSDDSNGYMMGSANNDIIHMNGGNDAAYGGAGNDLMTGGDGDDYLYGADGNDTLAGNDGVDYLNGGAGVDTFVFEAATAFNDVDTIGDFTVSDGDKLDLSDLVIGYVPGTSDINDYLSFTADTWNKTLVVDRDGTGSTYSGEEVVVINNGVSQVGTIDDLFNNDQIIV